MALFYTILKLYTPNGVLSSTYAKRARPAVLARPAVPLGSWRSGSQYKGFEGSPGRTPRRRLPRLSYGQPQGVQPVHTSHTASRHGPAPRAGQPANGGNWAACPSVANSPGQPQGPHSGALRLTGQRTSRQDKALGDIIPAGVVGTLLHQPHVALIV